MKSIKGVIFDLDMTLVDTSSAEEYRKAGDWKKAVSRDNPFKRYSGLVEVFSYLKEKKIKITIVTNSVSFYAKAVLERFNIPFDFLIAYHDTKKNGYFQIKPKSYPMELALDKMALCADEVISFGDDINDLKSSYAAKIRSVGCLWGCNEEKRALLKSVSYICIRTCEEIIDIINHFDTSGNYELRYFRRNNKCSFDNNEYKYSYLINYYPQKHFPEMEDIGFTNHINRRKIWSFKHGKSYYFETFVINYLKLNYNKDFLANAVFCVIPASTKEKHDIRYLNFCNDVSNATGIQNGFHLIGRLKDREAKHENIHVKEDITKLDFRKGFFHGKNVILFDDIITSGHTFSLIADEIQKYGGNVIEGVFLGKTVEK